MQKKLLPKLDWLVVKSNPADYLDYFKPTDWYFLITTIVNLGFPDHRLGMLIWTIYLPQAKGDFIPCRCVSTENGFVLFVGAEPHVFDVVTFSRGKCHWQQGIKPADVMYGVKELIHLSHDMNRDLFRTSRTPDLWQEHGLYRLDMVFQRYTDYYYFPSDTDPDSVLRRLDRPLYIVAIRSPENHVVFCHLSQALELNRVLRSEQDLVRDMVLERFCAPVTGIA